MFMSLFLVHHGIIGSSADNSNAFHMIPQEARSAMLRPPRPDGLLSSDLAMFPPGMVGPAASASADGAWSMNNLPVNRHDIPNRPETAGMDPLRHFLPNGQSKGDGFG